MRISSRPRSAAWCWPARSSTTRGGASAIPNAGSGPPSSSPTACCATRASSSRPTPRPGTGSASSRPTTACPNRRRAREKEPIVRRRQATAAAQAVRNPTRTMTTPMTASAPPTHPTTATLKPTTVRARTDNPTPLQVAIPRAPGRSWTHRECTDDGAGARQAPADASSEEQAWDEAMHQALSLAKAQGKAPGAVGETIQGAHRSTLDWRSLLRRYMTDAAARDYSWSVPNRRFIDSGLYLPSIRSEGMGTLAVIIDTSGSRGHRCSRGLLVGGARGRGRDRARAHRRPPGRRRGAGRGALRAG